MKKLIMALNRSKKGFWVVRAVSAERPLLSLRSIRDDTGWRNASLLRCSPESINFWPCLIISCAFAVFCRHRLWWSQKRNCASSQASCRSPITNASIISLSLFVSLRKNSSVPRPGGSAFKFVSSSFPRHWLVSTERCLSCMAWQ
jgi:hypothetical protein